MIKGANIETDTAKTNIIHLCRKVSGDIRYKDNIAENP